jgi:hypothetical protein
MSQQQGEDQLEIVERKDNGCVRSMLYSMSNRSITKTRLAYRA